MAGWQSRHQFFQFARQNHPEWNAVVDAVDGPGTIEELEADLRDLIAHPWKAPGSPEAAKKGAEGLMELLKTH